MRILTVEDDPVSRRILAQALKGLHHDVVEAVDGAMAWELWKAEPFRIVVSDWTMPEMDGLELCHNIRSQPSGDYTYFILLTGRGADRANRREAMEAGVDDFLTKPLESDDLWMRLRVAERILRYATQVRQLETFLPMCSYCKKIRDDQNYWQQIETYINERTGTDFSHSVCPDCYDSVVKAELERLRTTMPPPPARPKPHVRRVTP